MFIRKLKLSPKTCVVKIKKVLKEVLTHCFYLNGFNSMHIFLQCTYLLLLNSTFHNDMKDGFSTIKSSVRFLPRDLPLLDVFYIHCDGNETNLKQCEVEPIVTYDYSGNWPYLRLKCEGMNAFIVYLLNGFGKVWIHFFHVLVRMFSELFLNSDLMVSKFRSF